MSNFIKLFIRDERGVTAIEYGLIAGVLALGILASVTNISGALTTTFGHIVTAVTH